MIVKNNVKLFLYDQNGTWVLFLQLNNSRLIEFKQLYYRYLLVINEVNLA